MEIDSSFESKAILWLYKSFLGIHNHYNPDSNNFFRNSEDLNKEELYPTATFHCFNTIENFIQIEDYLFLRNRKEDKFRLKKMYNSFREYVLTNSFNKLLDSSSNKIDNLRKYVLIERYISCIYTFRNEQECESQLVFNRDDINMILVVNLFFTKAE